MKQDKNEVGLLIKNVNESLEKMVNASFAELGITMAQVRVLLYIISQPQKMTTQKNLEVCLNVSHPTINGLLHRLEEKGFVTTEITAGGRFSKVVRITAAGEQVLAESGKTKGVNEKILTRGMTAEETEAFSRLLQRVLVNVQSMKL